MVVFNLPLLSSTASETLTVGGGDNLHTTCSSVRSSDQEEGGFQYTQSPGDTRGPVVSDGTYQSDEGSVEVKIF